MQFARAEGILPAPEPTHAISVAIDEALRCKEEGKRRSSSSTSAGTATSTSARTSAIWPGTLEDYELPQERIEHALETVPSV